MPSLDSLVLLFDRAISEKLKSCGISFLDLGLELVDLALLYNKTPDQFWPTKKELEIAGDTLKAVAGNAQFFDNLRYVQDLANGDLCVSMAWNKDILHAGRLRRMPESQSI